MRIRFANIEDKERINELFIQMNNYINKLQKNNSIDYNYLENGYDNYINEFFNNKNKFIIVVDYDGMLVGYLSCILYPNEEESYLYLDDFCVDEKYRSRGIGTKLIESARQYAVLNNVLNMKLHVNNTNGNAFRFYSNLGFVPKDIYDERIEMNKTICRSKILKKVF